jgi:phosphoglycolate phosphatase-like HAD superfamily hydrolase
LPFRKTGIQHILIIKTLKKTLIIFDVDGTLVFSNKIDSQCFAETYQAIYKKKFPSIDWRRYTHVTDHTIFNAVIQEHFKRQAEQEEIDFFQDHFVGLLETGRRERPEEFLQVPAARETILHLLDQEEYAVGIGTGGWRRPACLKLQHVGIPVESLFFSAADGKETREDITKEAIRQAKAVHQSFDRIVYVGDAIWDVQTTRNLSLNFIGIRREGDVEVLLQAGATTVLQDFSDHDQFMKAVYAATPPKNQG